MRRRIHWAPLHNRPLTEQDYQIATIMGEANRETEEAIAGVLNVTENRREHSPATWWRRTYGPGFSDQVTAARGQSPFATC